MSRRRPEGIGHRAAFIAAALLACRPAFAADAPRDLASLASDRGCLSCHGLVRKQVGPGFAQIAERYRGDASAAARLAAKIRNGSVGAWGRVIMPAQAHVTAEEAQRLAAWVLARP